MSAYKKLKPFEIWCHDNFPYIEETFQELNYYELLCKIVEYLNTTIDNVDGIHNDFVTLKNFVDNYFDNLDVQEEINNKLDAMAQDGTLTNLIKNYVDPIYQAYEERIGNNIDSIENDVNTFKSSTENEIETFETSVNNTLNNFREDIESISSGSPAGVYATLAALQSADPDHSKIYIVEADGEWYFWNTSTSQWKNGGLYQSTGISNDYILSKHLSESLRDTVNIKKFDFSNIKFELGSIDPGTGTLTDNNTRIRNKEVVYCKKGSIIRSTSSTMKWKVVKYLTSKATSYIGQIPLDGHSTVHASTVIDEDCYVRILLFNPQEGQEIIDDGTNFASITSNINADLYTDKFIEVNKELYDKNKLAVGYLRSSDGQVVPNPLPSDSGFSKYCCIEVNENKRVKICIKNKDASNVCNMMLFFDKNNNYINYMKAFGSMDCKIPNNAKYVYFNLNNTYINDYSIMLLDNLYNQDDFKLLKNEPKVKLIAHRGYNSMAPEATIPAYELAGQHGFWGCKIDICETSDGVFVCSHDSTVDRMFDGTGAIKDLTFAQIREMTVDSGSHIEDYPGLKIVTLKEALSICKKYGMHPYIEFKSLLNDYDTNNVWRIIKSYNLEDVTLCQSSDGRIDYLRTLRGISYKPTIILWRNTFNPTTDLPFVENLGNALLSLNSFSGSEVSQFEANIDELKEIGTPVCTAVCTNLTYAKKWIKDYGLDLIVTSNITYEDLKDI